MENEIKFEFVSRILPKEGENPIVNENIQLPEKGSKYAAGYDFINPEDTWVASNGVTYVKTGIKAKFPKDTALLLLNRSSNPKKKQLFLANGIGLVDADYYNNSDNEGEICFAFMTTSDTPILIKAGEKLGQGMFIKYQDVTGLNVDDVEERNGGFGSTRCISLWQLITLN